MPTRINVAPCLRLSIKPPKLPNNSNAKVIPTRQSIVIPNFRGSCSFSLEYTNNEYKMCVFKSKSVFHGINVIMSSSKWQMRIDMDWDGRAKLAPFTFVHLRLLTAATFCLTRSIKNIVQSLAVTIRFGPGWIAVRIVAPVARTTLPLQAISWQRTVHHCLCCLDGGVVEVKHVSSRFRQVDWFWR